MSPLSVDSTIVELNDTESAALFDRIVQREMNMTSEEFLTRWDRGDYEHCDYDDVPGLVTVWMYLPAVRG